MASWKDVEHADPEFAARVRRIFDAHRHKTIATLRVDGSPRISGIEAQFDDGELTFGSMPGARKGADLRRDRAVRAAQRHGRPAGRRSRPAGRGTPRSRAGRCTSEISRGHIRRVVPRRHRGDGTHRAERDGDGAGHRDVAAGHGAAPRRTGLSRSDQRRVVGAIDRHRSPVLPRKGRMLRRRVIRRAGEGRLAHRPSHRTTRSWIRSNLSWRRRARPASVWGRLAGSEPSAVTRRWACGRTAVRHPAFGVPRWVTAVRSVMAVRPGMGCRHSDRRSPLTARSPVGDHGVVPSRGVAGPGRGPRRLRR